MRVQSGRLISLGYDKYVRSDDVMVVEPVTEARGPGRRTLVWVRGLDDPIVASRAVSSIVTDLISPTISED